jgi:hypothetical protein
MRRVEMIAAALYRFVPCRFVPCCILPCAILLCGLASAAPAQAEQRTPIRLLENTRSASNASTSAEMAAGRAGTGRYYSRPYYGGYPSSYRERHGYRPFDDSNPVHNGYNSYRPYYHGYHIY